MAKRLRDIQIDGVGFNVPYWAGKTLAEFVTEATKPDAEMIPKDVAEKDKQAWCTTAHGLIVKADNGDESVTPTVNTEELKAEAEKAAAAKSKKKEDKPNQ